MRELLKTWCVPGSLSYFGVMVACLLPWLVIRQTRTLAAILLGAAVLLTGSLALPVVAQLIASPITLEDEPSRTSRADAVVLLVGDSPQGRAAEALRIYFECHPRWFIVSGSPAWAELLRASGVPADRLLVEWQSRNTYEQAAMLEPLAAQHHIRRVFLVASQLHIRRAVGTFRTRGYDVIPVPSPIDYRPLQGRWTRFVPQKAALALSRAAIYEYAAWSYYRWEGWLAPQQTPIFPLPRRPSL